MSRLGELIAKYCPNGVKYVKLASVCGIYDGTHQTPKYTDNGIKFASVENIADPFGTNKYISEDDFNRFKVKPQIGDVLMTRIGSIGICSVIHHDEPLAYYVSLALLRPNGDYLDSRFLKYAIESLHGRKELRKWTLVNAVPIKINTGDIGRVTIPIPPIEVQREIVRILDNFTELTAELTKELATELTARKKQYVYYRDHLLSFGDNVVWRTLGDIGKVCMCKRIMKDETSPNGDIPFFKIGTFGKQADAYISQELFDRYRQQYSYPKKGDILISAAGTIGRTVVFDGEPSYFQDSNIVWLDNDETQVTNEFLFYWYQTNPWKVSEGGTIARLYNDNISGAKVPVLPKDQQKRIVRVLSKFDAICSDLNIGLPAEIEARKKQYEYYRNLLLSFADSSQSVNVEREREREREQERGARMR